MKKLTKIALTGACSIAAMSVLTPCVFAQSTKDQNIHSDSKFTLSLSVTKGCRMTLPTDFDFGVAPRVWNSGSALDVPPAGSWRNRISHTMTVTCTNGTVYDLTFKGSHDQADDSTRRFMSLVGETYVAPGAVNSTPDNRKILYYIRRDSFFGTGVGDQASPSDGHFPDGTGSGRSDNYTLYLIVDKNNWATYPPIAGRYEDQVTAEVRF